MKKRARKNYKEQEPKINKISVADFEIASSKASLQEIEECINRLIKKNKKFAEFRRKKILSEQIGMIG